MHVRFDHRAQVELSHAERHYHAEEPTLAVAFLETVEHAIGRIQSFPESGSEYLAGTRRVVLERFPYSLVYLLDEAGAVIVALAHHRQKPGYWRSRL